MVDTPSPPQPPNTPPGPIALSAAVNSKVKEPPSRLVEQPLDRTSDDGVAPSLPSPLLFLPQPASSSPAGSCTHNRQAREDGEPSLRASPNQRPSQPARRSRQHRLQDQDQDPHVSVAARLNEQCMEDTSDDGVAPSLPSPLLFLPQPASSSSAGSCTHNRQAREDGEPSLRASPNQRPSQPARRSRVQAKTKHDEVAKSFLPGPTHTITQLGLHGIRRGA
jgi:hypothetical protein